MCRHQLQKMQAVWLRKKDLPSLNSAVDDVVEAVRYEYAQGSRHP